jgi:hypothetical protein
MSPPDPRPEFRPLQRNERALLDALLAASFPGKETLAAQIALATARLLDGDGSLELAVRDAPAATVVRRIPVEAEVEDRDGVTIHILLHVVDGYANELEVFREDGAPVQRPMDPDRLRIIVL